MYTELVDTIVHHTDKERGGDDSTMSDTLHRFLHTNPTHTTEMMRESNRRVCVCVCAREMERERHTYTLATL